MICFTHLWLLFLVWPWPLIYEFVFFKHLDKLLFHNPLSHEPDLTCCTHFWPLPPSSLTSDLKTWRLQTFLQSYYFKSRRKLWTWHDNVKHVTEDTHTWMWPCMEWWPATVPLRNVRRLAVCLQSMNGRRQRKLLLPYLLYSHGTAVHGETTMKEDITSGQLLL